MAAQDSTETATDFNRFNPFGPGASADETRQAQQTNSNDTPTDVNINAVVVRSQSLTVDVLGKDFVRGSTRFNAQMDQVAADNAKK